MELAPLRRAHALVVVDGVGGAEEGAQAAAARVALAGGSVYTDDRAPVEWLIDASIVHVAAEGDR